MKWSTSFVALLPINGPSLASAKLLERFFGMGFLFPYQLLFNGTKSQTRIDSHSSFNLVQKVIKSLIDTEEIVGTPRLDSFYGIANLGNVSLSYETYTHASQCPTFVNDEGHTVPKCKHELQTTIATLSTSFFNSPSNLTTTYYAVLDVDPFSEEGGNWYFHARDILEHWEHAYNENCRVQNKTCELQLGLQGGATTAHEVVLSVRDAFPSMLKRTLVIIILLTGLLFRSIILPFITLASVLLTQMFAYGAAVLVYQEGMLNWTGIQGISQVIGGVNWFPPMFCFNLIILIGLDYDVFLITRVIELRRERNLGHVESIVQALVETRHVISWAGVIMTISLGGMIGCSLPLLNQIGFLLGVSVIMDAFVVRTLVAPILLGLFRSEIMWWPNQLWNEKWNSDL